MFVRRAPLPETTPLMWVDWFALAGITLWGLCWLAPGLGHPAIHNWDESFHHAVGRGTADSFFRPHMLVDPIYPLNLRQWWVSGIWMHKPTGVFWWAAAMIKLFGVHTWALRSASLLGELALAWLTFLFIRPVAGRALGIFAAGAFLVLPWGWFMVQGHFVADVTDITVAAFVALGIACLWMTVEKDSNRWAIAAGAAIGVGYLCKTFLSLSPLGVAGAWWALSLVGFCRGPTLKQVLLMWLAFVVVAGPWNLYAYHAWPDVYMRAFDHTVGFLDASSGEDVGSGARPPDAVFNELNFFVFGPLPYPLTFLCGVWLLISSLRTRDGREVMMTLWLWSTWLVHTYANVKGSSHLWNMMPAGLFAYAVTLRDAFKLRALAAAVIASLCVWEFKPVFSIVPLIKAHLPDKLVQTRTWSESNFVEQALVVPVVIIAISLVGLWLRKKPKLARRVAVLSGTTAVLGVFAFAYPRAVSASLAQIAKFERDDQWDQAQDVGVALDAAVDKKSVLYLDSHADYGTNFEHLNLMFWSGRMTYRQAPDVATATAHGYHPYLVVPMSEAFEPVPVPAFAQLRAYDLLKPTPAEAPLPDGIQPLAGEAPNYDLLGWSARELTSRWSRYAFYVHPKGPLTNLKVTYRLDDGQTIVQPLELRATCELPQNLAAHQWFVLPAVGPPLDHLKAVVVGP